MYGTIAVAGWLERMEEGMKLDVYSRRWGHVDSYTILMTDTGWHVSHEQIAGRCDKTGSPFLFKNLNQDYINYPAALGKYLEWLWDFSKEESIGEQMIQEALDRLGEWIQITEKASPEGVFTMFK